jgi:exopolysaccharide biosynthesis protein
MNAHRATRIVIKLSILFVFLNIGFGQDAIDLFPKAPGALTVWSETRSTPRPLRIHYLKVSFNVPELEVFTLPAEDPDGAGPAESELTMPLELFAKFKPLAAINANAFAQMPGEKPDWHEKQAVDIHGLVASHGKIISPVEKNRTSFWIDANNKPHIGLPAPQDSIKEGVADWFSPLLIDSRIVPDSSNPDLHPRTAVGFDDKGAMLLIVVVDGRQPGFSEGVSLYELARIMQEKGCAQSLNLDGGGSSVMLVKEPGKEPRTVNSPSGKTHRPVPVMLGVREARK